jgi:low affinity Fe/Cu permease
MTKQEIEQKIKEILLKDDRFKNAKVIIEFKEKSKIQKAKTS